MQTDAERSVAERNHAAPGESVERGIPGEALGDADHLLAERA
jgi:hypothetical protein